MSEASNTEKVERAHYAKWRDVMQAYEASGLSQMDYCEKHGHSFRQFKYYRSRFSQLSKSKANGVMHASSFVPVKLSTPMLSGLRIELGHGVYCMMKTLDDAVFISALLRGLR